MLADPNLIEIRTGLHPFYIWAYPQIMMMADLNPIETKGNGSEYYKSIDYNYTKEIKFVKHYSNHSSKK